jgi:hypothetical protein
LTATSRLNHLLEYRGAQVLWAVGRSPATSKLNLCAAGVNVVASGHIPVDDFENTNVPGVCDTSARHLFVAANLFVTRLQVRHWRRG